MSQREKIIIGVLVVLVLVAGAWYLFTPSASPTANTAGSVASSTNTANGAPTATTAKATTLHALTTQGGNYTCTVDTSTGDSKTSGTVYAAGGKTRLNFVSTDSHGNDTTIHIIRANGYSYTWVNGQTSGVKAAITASGAIVKQPQGGVIAVTDTTQFSSNCHPWVPDAAEFVTPTGVIFKAS